MTPLLLADLRIARKALKECNLRPDEVHAFNRIFGRIFTLEQVFLAAQNVIALPSDKERQDRLVKAMSFVPR